MFQSRRRWLKVTGVVLLGLAIALPFAYCVVHGFTVMAPIFWAVIIGLMALAERRKDKLTVISPRRAIFITVLILLVIVMSILLLDYA